LGEYHREFENVSKDECRGQPIIKLKPRCDFQWSRNWSSNAQSTHFQDYHQNTRRQLKAHSCLHILQPTLYI